MIVLCIVMVVDGPSLTKDETHRPQTQYSLMSMFLKRQQPPSDAKSHAPQAASVELLTCHFTVVEFGSHYNYKT